MTKVLLVFLLFIVGGSFSSIEGTSFDKMDFQTFVDDLALSMIEWENPVIKKCENLYDVDDTVIGTLYRVYEKNIQAGYFVYLDDFGIVEVTFEGSDEASTIKGKVYYSFPSGFFNENFRDSIEVVSSLNSEEKRYGSGVGVIVDATWNWFNVLIEYDETQITYDFNSGIPLLRSHVTSTSSNYHYQAWIEDVPDFLNYDDDFACVPTATTMMMAYYDNVYIENFTEHDDGLYPFVADGSSDPEAKGLIEEFIDVMHSDKGWGGVDGTSPAVLFVNGLPGSPYEVNHSVVGIGHHTSMILGEGFLVYDENTHGMKLITDDFVEFFGFIYND